MLTLNNNELTIQNLLRFWEAGQTVSVPYLHIHIICTSTYLTP
jgi:hypothetical protein